MNKLFTLFAIPLFAFTLSFAQDADSTASDAPDGEIAEEAAEQPALSDDDERLFADIGKICAKRFCAIELFFKNGTYSQMTKSKSSLSNEELYDYDAGHSDNGEFSDKDAQKRDIADKLKQMCEGKEFCTLEATLHGPSFTLASLRNVTTDIRPKNQNVPRYDGIHYSNDTETAPFIVDATKAPAPVTRVAPATTAPEPATMAPATTAASPAPAAKKKPAKSKANKEFSHAIAFSLGFLGEEYYGEIGTDPAHALELFPRYNFKWAGFKYATLTIGAGIAFRTNTLDFDEEWDVYDYYYYYSSEFTEKGSINYQNLTLDIPVSIRLGGSFYGSLTIDLRKPICEWYDYQLDFYQNDRYYSFKSDKGDGFDFFDYGDAEIGLWIGAGFTYNSIGFELQALIANGAGEDDNHLYRPIFYGDFSYSTRITVEYTF